MRSLFFLLVFFGSLQSMSRAPQPVAVVENVGVRTLNYTDVQRKCPVVVELWYPTPQTGPIDLPEESVWIHPKEIRNGAFAQGKHPLVLLSHGHWGDRRDRSWLAELLAKKGYIVASVEHHGNSWRSFNPVMTLRFWERARDISFAISQLLTDSALRDRIDAKRIGFVGYSLGGMTGLALAGAKARVVQGEIPELEDLKSEFGSDVFEKMDFSEAHRSYADPRIKAFVLLTPAAFSYPPDSLKAIRAPVALIASEGDEILPFEKHAKKVLTHLIPKKVKIWKNQVSHYVFLNRVSEKGKQTLKPELQAESVERDRAIIHKEVGDFIAEFFQEHLF